MKIWDMRIACWIRKATNTQSRNVILIAFPLQQMLHEGASILYMPVLLYSLMQRLKFHKFQKRYLRLCYCMLKVILYVKKLSKTSVINFVPRLEINNI
jgi:hypothetical protein